MPSTNFTKKIAILFCFIFSCAACLSEKPTEDVPASAVRVSTDADTAEPAIASDRDGNLYLVYVEHGTDKRDDLYLQKMDGEMENTGPQTRVNTIPGIAKTWRGDPPTIAVGPNGSIYVDWTRRSRAALI